LIIGGARRSRPWNDTEKKIPTRDIYFDIAAVKINNVTNRFQGVFFFFFEAIFSEKLNCTSNFSLAFAFQ
jgi:hypothetical protein